MTDNRNDPLRGSLHDQRPDPLGGPDHFADDASQAATTWLPMSDGGSDPYDVANPRLGVGTGDAPAFVAAGAAHAFDPAAPPRATGPTHATDPFHISQLGNTTHDQDNVPPQAHVPAGARPAERPVVTGVNMAAVVTGLLVALAGGLAALQVLTGDTIDWSRVGPGLFTGIGITLVLIGTVGVVRRRPCRNGSPGEGC